MKTIIYISLLLMGMVFAEELVESNTTSDELVALHDTYDMIMDKKTTATRSDITVIESSENIIYISQKMVKDYLFLSINPKNIIFKNKLTNSLNQLNEDLKMIARTTKNSDTKDLLDYLAYSKDEISEILKSTIDSEQSALMLDYSETLLEGGQSMIGTHQYDFTSEEKMLSIAKKIEYLLSRITKYYFANHLGFDTDENKELMKNSIADFEENIEKINDYAYPNEMKKIKDEMVKVWTINKIFFTENEKNIFIPNLVFISMNHLEQMVDKLTEYHRKNQ